MINWNVISCCFFYLFISFQSFLLISLFSVIVLVPYISSPTLSPKIHHYHEFSQIPFSRNSYVTTPIAQEALTCPHLQALSCYLALSVLGTICCSCILLAPLNSSLNSILSCALSHFVSLCNASATLPPSFIQQLQRANGLKGVFH